LHAIFLVYGAAAEQRQRGRGSKPAARAGA
jgi:hypothetical protein